jgi:hypothetical protein
MPHGSSRIGLTTSAPREGPERDRPAAAAGARRTGEAPGTSWVPDSDVLYRGAPLNLSSVYESSPEGGDPIEVTCRTLHSRFRLRPTYLRTPEASIGRWKLCWRGGSLHRRRVPSTPVRAPEQECTPHFGCDGVSMKEVAA